MVDPQTIETAAHFLSNGSIAAVLALLLGIIIGLVWERLRLIKKNDELTAAFFDSKKEELESVRRIIDMYHQGNLNLIQTLAEIKGVLANIHINPSNRR